MLVYQRVDRRWSFSKYQHWNGTIVGNEMSNKSALEIWQMSHVKQSALKWSINIFEHP